jgi:hypothetical protein
MEGISTCLLVEALWNGRRCHFLAPFSLCIGMMKHVELHSSINVFKLRIDGISLHS